MRVKDSFANKTVFITGAASGLGRALSHRFFRMGSNLVLVDKNKKGLEKLKHQFPQDRIEIVTFDLSNTEKIEELFGRLFQVCC